MFVETNVRSPLIMWYITWKWIEWLQSNLASLFILRKYWIMFDEVSGFDEPIDRPTIIVAIFLAILSNVIIQPLLITAGCG